MKNSKVLSIPKATTNKVPGARIAEILGIVVGIAIRNRGIGGNIMAGMASVGNGSALDDYREELRATRRDAVLRMEQEAFELGADAVVGVRFDSADVGREMVEVVAYGTAVVLRTRRIRLKTGSAADWATDEQTHSSLDHFGNRGR